MKKNLPKWSFVIAIFFGAYFSSYAQVYGKMRSARANAGTSQTSHYNSWANQGWGSKNGANKNTSGNWNTLSQQGSSSGKGFFRRRRHDGETANRGSLGGK